MKHVVVALGGLVSSLCFVACGSAPAPDPGTKSPTLTQDCESSQKNGYGICYPSQDIGTGVRSGNVAGNRIANFAFTGYTASGTGLVTPGTTKTIHLGDYYDPQQKGIPGVIGGVPIKIIHLVVSAVWCNPCNQETDFISGANYTGANSSNPPASFAAELAPLGVVFVQALDDGPVVGTGATMSDLNGWINNHKNDFTTFLDPGNQNLGVFFDAAAIPFNANIDARSMELLSGDVGFDTTLDTTIKQTALAWVNANPPKQ